ncbi:MAG: nuclear transport factor 2 family protein [bacterium]
MTNEAGHAATRTERGNIEIVRQVYAAFARRDIAAAFALLDPEVEFYQSDEVPWGGHYRGTEGAQAFFANLIGNISSTVVLQSFIDAGDSVVALGRTQGTVNASGARFDVPIAHAWTIRHGRVVRVQYFIDNPTMLAALQAPPAAS